MNVLSFVLFLHVVGMLGLFVALGLDGVSVFRLRRSSSAEELAPWIGLSAGLPRLYRGALALVVISGVYLTRGVLRGLPADAPMSDLAWLLTSVAALAGFAIVGALSLRRMQPIWRATKTGRGAAPSLQLPRAHDPLLPVFFVVRTVLAVAIVFLMMSRPPLEGSLLVVAVAAAVALASSGVAWRSGPVASAAS
jgi:hypothetical protein